MTKRKLNRFINILIIVTILILTIFYISRYNYSYDEIDNETVADNIDDLLYDVKTVTVTDRKSEGTVMAIGGWVAPEQSDPFVLMLFKKNIITQKYKFDRYIMTDLEYKTLIPTDSGVITYTATIEKGKQMIEIEKKVNYGTVFSWSVTILIPLIYGIVKKRPFF